MASDESIVPCHSLLATYVLVFAVLWYSIGTEIPLTQTLSHKGLGNFPSLDFVVSLRRELRRTLSRTMGGIKGG